MKLRKSRLSLAVGVVLGAAAMIPATSFGWSVNTSTVGLNTTSGGDTLLFPIYSTVETEQDGVPGNVTTSFSVINSGAETIVAKIRFREQEKSMDVLDFLVIFSPYDHFSFWVAQEPGAPTPHMSWTDTSCVVGPAVSSDGTEERVNFPDASVTQFVETNEQMSVGHLEVLGMATIPDNLYVSPGYAGGDSTQGQSLAAAAKHGPDGKPANCALLVTWLADTDNVHLLNQPGLLGDVPNDLSGRYLMTGVSGNSQGIEGGSDAIGIRDSNLTLNRSTGSIQITSQSNADCVQVGYSNCLPITTQYAWATREWDHPHLGEMLMLWLFQANLTAEDILGDWSNNPENYVGVDWVLSFPDKYAYLDYVDASTCAGGADTGKEWCLLDQTRTSVGWPSPYFGVPGVWTGTWGNATVGETSDCMGLTDNDLYVYNREEASAGATVTVSPGGRPTLDICHELQVFTIAAEGDTPRASIIQTADRRGVITFENLIAEYGWARMGLSWPLPGTDAPYPIGDAMTGIIFQTRATEDPTINNGSISELQKKVSPFDLPTPAAAP